MSSATAQELAVRTKVATVADASTLLQKVDSPGRLYAPITKTQLRLDLGLSPADNPAFAGLDVGSLSGIILGTDGVLSAITNNSSNWNTAYDHSQVAGGDSVHVSTAENSAWDSAYSHSGLTSGNPHSVTPAELSLVIGTNVQAHGGVLDDLNTLGANAADNEVLIGTSAGVLAWEKDATLRTSLGLGTGNNVEFTTITVNQGTINNVPSVLTSIATKGYVDSLGGGSSTFWTSVVVATTENIDLTQDLEAGDTIDGWTLVAGDRVLVKSQTDATENGLYTAVASGAASRSSDADTAAEILSRKCIILHGNTYEDMLFFCANASITLDVTEIEFNSLAGGGTYGVIELLGEEYVVGGDWTSPISVNDLLSEWDNENSSIDENESSFADHSYVKSEWWATLEFIVSECECSKIQVLAKKTHPDDTMIVRGHYYDGSWHTVGQVTVTATSSPAWYEISFGDIRTITKFKLDFSGWFQTGNFRYLYEVEYYNLTSTAQHKITLAAGTPTTNFTITFPDDSGSVNQAMLSNGSGVLSWGGHDDLADFAAGEHFLQTAITNVSTALSTGLLKVTTGSGALSVVADSSGNWNTAFGWGNHAGLYDPAGTMTTHLGNFAHSDISLNTTHSGLTSGNPHSVTPAELSLVIGTNVQAHDAGLLSLAGLTYAAPAFVKMTGANTFVLRTIGETADDLEATIDHDNLANGGAHDYAYISGNDGATGVTGAELEELTDGSETTLHSHAGAGGVDEFVELIDTPNSYDSVDIGKFLRLKDDLSGLEFAAVTSGGFTSRCRVSLTSTQSIASGDYYKLLLATEQWDNDGEWASNKFTAIAAGYYHVSYQVQVSALGVDKLVLGKIYKNGAAYSSTDWRYGSADNTSISCVGSDDVYLNGSTDYIEIFVIHTHGSNRNFTSGTDQNYVAIHRFA